MTDTETDQSVTAATRLLSMHFPKADRLTCLCGKEWHPRHQAEALAKTGLLR